MTPTEKIEQWVLTTLSEPNNKFGDLPPCPYAKKAWLNGNVDVKMWENKAEFEKDEWNKLVHIYIFDDIDSHSLSKIASEYNKKYPKYLFLEEHPELVEDVGGFVVNQGELILLIVQDREHLETARDKLMETDYYKHWTPEMKERIIER